MSKERLYSSSDIINAFIAGFNLGDGYGWQSCNDGHTEDAKIAVKEHINQVLTVERDERKLPIADMKDLRQMLEAAIDTAIAESCPEDLSTIAYMMNGRGV